MHGNPALDRWMARRPALDRWMHGARPSCHARVQCPPDLPLPQGHATCVGAPPHAFSAAWPGPRGRRRGPGAGLRGPARLSRARPWTRRNAERGVAAASTGMPRRPSLAPLKRRRRRRRSESRAPDRRFPRPIRHLGRALLAADLPSTRRLLPGSGWALRRDPRARRRRHARRQRRQRPPTTAAARPASQPTGPDGNGVSCAHKPTAQGWAPPLPTATQHETATSVWRRDSLPDRVDDNTIAAGSL